ncbi:MAG: DNA repair protein RecO [Waddliaceae bacterium]
MSLCRTEGVIIHALDFRDDDKILTVFSPDNGLIKLLMKRVYAGRRASPPVTAPLTRCEFIYKTRKNGLLLCQETSIIDQQLILRRHLKTLEVACELLQLIKMSQFPNKPAPQLYDLLIRYFRSIPHFSFPEVLAASFRLKLLRHEGLFGIATICHVCHAPLTDRYLAMGESFCRQHTPSHALFFSQEEIVLVKHLACCRTLTELQQFPCHSDFRLKVTRFFEDAIAQ